MRSIILLALVCICIPVSAQKPPDDSGLYHVVTVVADPPTQLDAALTAAFQTHPDLAPIYARCKRFQFKTSDPLYRARYAESLPPAQTPIVALVRSDGGVLYKATGQNIPAPDILAKQLIDIANADKLANGSRTEWRPDGSRIPSMLPHPGRIIPDTVDVHHDVSLTNGQIAMVVGVILVLMLAGLCIFGLFAGILLLRGE